MLLDGTARRSESSWSSELHIVRKKDNGWRPCGDYRALNSRTIPDRYPVRQIHDCSHQFSGCCVFSKVDLVRAYSQIPVHPGDIQKTAITTPFGLFEFPFMSFDLRNAPQTFQSFLDDIFRDWTSVLPTWMITKSVSSFSPDRSKCTNNIFGLSSTGSRGTVS
jgi:hypothetical protein